MLIAVSENSFVSLKPMFLIHHWSKRFLTVLGRIVVVKSLLLPKLNHLILALPHPDKEIVKEIDSMFYKFIWGGKVDRVSRNHTALPTTKRGTNMIQFEHFARALKITWIRRLLKYDADNKILNLFMAITPISNFDFSSVIYWDKIINSCKNTFWKSVFSAWKDFVLVLNPNNREEVLRSSIWHNAKIKVGNKSVLYKTWYDHGILYINDLLTKEGEFISVDDMYRKYGVRTNFLRLLGLRKAIENSFSNMLGQSKNVLQLPFQSLHVKTVRLDTKGCKRFYNIFQSGNKVEYKCINKWNALLASHISEVDWCKICFYNWKSTHDVKLKWFQFRILNRILGTNSLLVKIGRSDDASCTFCGEVEESIIHLLWDCQVTQKIWKDLQNWIQFNLNTRTTLNKDLVIFGNYNFSDFALNNIILICKFCIYKSKMRSERPSFTLCKNALKNFYLKERFMYKTNCKQHDFDTRWHTWKSLFL